MLGAWLQVQEGEETAAALLRAEEQRDEAHREVEGAKAALQSLQV